MTVLSLLRDGPEATRGQVCVEAACKHVMHICAGWGGY